MNNFCIPTIKKRKDLRDNYCLKQQTTANVNDLIKKKYWKDKKEK